MRNSVPPPHTQLGNLRTSWDRRVGGTLRAIRRDDHVDLDVLTCIPGEDRRDRPFTVGVCPDCYERSSLALTTRDRPRDKNQCALHVIRRDRRGIHPGRFVQIVIDDRPTDRRSSAPVANVQCSFARSTMVSRSAASR